MPAVGPSAYVSAGVGTYGYVIYVCGLVRVIRTRLNASFGDYATMDRTLTVRGVGTASAAPDAVVIEGSISGRRPAYAEALAASSATVAALRKAVGEAGFDMDSLKTSGMTVGAVYRAAPKGGDPVFDGFEFRHGISIRADASDENLGRLMEAMAACEGAPSLRVSYEVSDPAPHVSAARAAAVRDARRCAKELASAAGVKLGDVAQISYDSENYSMSGYARPREAALGSLVPEEEEFTERVAVTWLIS